MFQPHPTPHTEPPGPVREVLFKEGGGGPEPPTGKEKQYGAQLFPTPTPLCPSPNLFCPFSSQMAGTLTKVSLDGNCS